ncbi:type III pantothenate kinase [Mesonia sp. MT50]|uniref:Type III pantothenate kinase n=1 Tax=Mesonia profundi TaxID=3070998 RepID=A0ABU1A0F6_9FLAO|nr:type III pantothenate kinase [Mesonia profundi]MDQ7916196.1 type III pantothenate kinase [Mesonia profundi]
MKNLAIDIGNTLVKLAVFEDGRLLELKITPAENISFVLNKLVISHPEISESILASVAGIHKDVIANSLKNQSILELTATTPVPFRNLYETPHSLGIDRIALTVAATCEYPNKNVLVIDAGTCITYDMVTKNKEYVGGAISPGVNMRLEAMHNFTSKLPLIRIEKETSDKIIGTTTQENLEIGALMGAALEINGFIESYELQYQDLTVILTGGDSQLLSKKVKNGIFASYNFLLKGLNHILEFNTTK